MCNSHYIGIDHAFVNTPGENIVTSLSRVINIAQQHIVNTA